MATKAKAPRPATTGVLIDNLWAMREKKRELEVQVKEIEVQIKTAQEDLMLHMQAEGEYFIESMAEIGIHVTADNIFFSGFCSQGDGAAFKGAVDNWAKMFKHLGLQLMFLGLQAKLLAACEALRQAARKCSEIERHISLPCLQGHASTAARS